MKTDSSRSQSSDNQIRRPPDQHLSVLPRELVRNVILADLEQYQIKWVYVEVTLQISRYGIYLNVPFYLSYFLKKQYSSMQQQ